MCLYRLKSIKRSLKYPATWQHREKWSLKGILYGNLLHNQIHIGS